jgi:amino acid adenylation domain-containing protein
MQDNRIVEGYQLSPQQAHIWLLQQADGSPAYKAQSAVLIEGEIDVEIMKAAASEIVSRHEILRTTFHLLPGMAVPLQAIASNQDLAFQEIDLSGGSSHETRTRFEELFRKEVLRNADLKQDPPARFCLLRLSVTESILVTSLPSVCVDGRSLKNLFSEIARAYEARLRRENLPGQPIQYVDFSEWQKEMLEQEGDGDGRLNRQNTHFSSISPPALGLEREPNMSSGFEPGSISFELDAEIVARIDQISFAHHAAPEIFLLACWQLLIWRLTGREEITTHYLCEGRRAESSRGAIGPYARFCPIQSQLEPDYQFAEMLEMVELSIRSVEMRLDHILQQDINPKKATADRSRAASSGAISFEYEEWPGAERAGSVKFSYWKQYCCIDRFKLKLSAFRKAEGLTIEFQYDPSIYTRKSVELIRERYLRLVESAASSEQIVIRDLEIIGQREFERLLVEWNETEKAPVDNRFIHELISEQARLRPDSIAVIYQGERLSYRELEGRANQLANHLRSLGVGPEVVVGLYLERSTEMMIGLLGVLKAGGAYLPLETKQPAGRLGVMVEDAGVKVLLTKQGQVEGLPSVARKVLLDRDWKQIAERSRLAPAVELSPENLAYVIYTSGSTGRPKGVMVRHRSVLNLLEGLKRDIYEEAGDALTLSVNAPLAFDASVKQVIQLARGYRLCIVPEGDRVDGAALLECIVRGGVEALDCTPSQLRLLAEAGLERERGGLGIVLVGGEPIDARSWDEMSQSINVRYYNVYGPTECTVDATVCRVDQAGTPTIGRPITNTRIYILDERGEVTPTGVVGEIYIGGAGLARGYMEEAGMTGEKFVPDPFGKRSGDRLYRTGDLGKYLEDGRIVCEGRKDNQVKLRGYRIELGEIEKALRSHECVREAVVTLREDEPGQKRLVGYAVLMEREEPRKTTNWSDTYESSESGEALIRRPEGVISRVGGPAPDEVTEGDLGRYLKERLPDYMVPARVVLMKDLPLTRNGKVDRGVLPRPEEISGQGGEQETYCQNVYEEMISGVWKEELNLSRVGKRDNFFEIGGHSLLATRVIARVRDLFKVDIGVRSIFEDASIEGLARRVEEAIKAGTWENAPPLVRVPREGGLPLSFAQQRLWFLDQLVPNDPLYNCPCALMLEGILDLKALERVINEIVKRHEVLRTRIEVEEGAPVQVIDEWRPRSLDVTDLTSLTHEEREAEVRKLVREEAVRGFDLGKWPLMRVKLLKLEEKRHVGLFTMHHIVSDEWSMGILIREVGALYNAYSAGEDARLPALELQYADYAVWQRKYLAGEVLEGEVGYWKERLKGAAVIELPTDRARPASPTYRGGIEGFDIGKELSEGLRGLGRREGVTMFMALLAAFKVVLMRWSGETDVSVGTVIANRTRREVEGLIGFFVNTLVLRTDLGGNPSFRDLIKQEREVTLGAYGRQEVPFEKLVEELNPDRGLGRSPLFQVMIAVQNVRREELEIKGLKVSWIEEEIGTAKFDLTLVLMEDRERIWGNLEYSEDLYEGETIRRMARHYERVIEEVVKDAKQLVGEIELMTGAERRQIIEEWNGTEKICRETPLVHEMIELQAARNPDAVAVVYEEQALSYRELNRSANQMAHYLRGLGVGPEVVVGLRLEKSLDMAVGLLGVLKAGGAYLPLSPDSPVERSFFMLEDSQAQVLLTQWGPSEGPSWQKRLPQAVVLYLDSIREQFAAESGQNPDNRTSSDNLAYVIYTSGSTGQPKGVAITYSAITQHCLDVVKSYDLTANDHVLHFGSFNFDVSLEQILPTWISGAKLIFNETRVWESVDFARQVKELELSVVNIPSTYWRQVAAGRAEAAQSVVPNRLRLLVIGSETVLAEDVRLWRQKAYEGVRLLNAYGPTETTITATTFEFKHERAKEIEQERISIGRPLGNRTAYVSDSLGNLVPVGITGMLQIGGAGVARGYVRRPELTAEKFTPDPFSGQVGARLYKTGDLTRYLPDGNIEFISRIDHQIKLRGYRIEPGEIEAALATHKAILQAVAIAREDEPGNRRLVAYVVSDEELNTEQLRESLRQKLPEYMVPEAILALEKMPVTANGKIDRQRLPAVEARSRRRKRKSVDTHTPVEEILIGILEELLKVYPIGKDDNFFELGGHSLLATQVISRVRSSLGMEIGVRTIFEEPRVENMARRIEKAMRMEERDEAPPLVRAPAAERSLLSFAQQRLWVIEQLDPGNTLYNCPGAAMLEGNLNLEVLEKVINEIFRRHEALRTRIEVEGGAPVQVIDPWEPRKLIVEDLTGLSPEVRAEEVQRIMRVEARTKFDLQKGPLATVKALKLQREQHVFLFTMHHIVSDGWSMGILVKEVGALYQALSAGEEASLPELQIQYADYAYWQRQYLTNHVLEKHLSYWRKQLGGKLPALNLAGDYPRPPVPTYRGAAKLFSLPAGLHQSLKALSRREGVTLYMTLLAAFKTLLYRYTAQEDIIVGTVVASRNRSELEPLIGFFVNMLPIRTDLSGNPRFRELLRRVKETTLEGYAHQDLPFEKLVKEIQSERAEWEIPLFNIAFGVQNAPGEDLRLDGIKISPMAVEQERARFDLTLWITEGIEDMQVRWSYSKDLFVEETIMRMHGHFEALLFSIVGRPDARLTALKIFPDSKTELDHGENGDWKNFDPEEQTPGRRKGVNLPAELL